MIDRIVIMSAGVAKRWKNHLNIPKQLICINGERLLDRTIRLLKERNISDIWVTVREYNQFGNLGVKEFLNLNNNVYNIDRMYGAKELAPAIFLYGDVYYTENAIDLILSDTNEFRFFGRRYKGIIKNNTEIYGVKVNDWVLHQAKELRDLNESKEARDSLLQHLLMYCLGNRPVKGYLNMAKEEFTPMFTDIDDETTDIDAPDEYELFISKLKRKEFFK